MNSDLNIAVFGDLHGHLRLMLQLCRVWQNEHRLHLDGVLQCGDLGYFPYPSRIDKATKRFAEDNPEELGFARYFLVPYPVKVDPISEKILGAESDGFDRLQCPIYWVNGNHEDFEALSELKCGSSVVPVDYYDAFLWLQSGNVVSMGQLQAGGVGGGPETQSRKLHPLMFVQERDCTALLGQQFDVLVSHSGPMGIGGPTDMFGSEHLRVLDEIAKPAYHFFAHHGDPVAPASIGQTRCFWLNDVAFAKSFGISSRPVNTGCMGILKWRDREHHNFEIVDEPWFKALNNYNWQSWTPGR